MRPSNEYTVTSKHHTLTSVLRFLLTTAKKHKSTCYGTEMVEVTLLRTQASSPIPDMTYVKP